MAETGNRPRAEPTEEEIAEMTARIRKGWSDTDRANRRVCNAPGWSPPRFKDGPEWQASEP